MKKLTAAISFTAGVLLAFLSNLVPSFDEVAPWADSNRVLILSGIAVCFIISLASAISAIQENNNSTSDDLAIAYQLNQLDLRLNQSQEYLQKGIENIEAFDIEVTNFLKEKADVTGSPNYRQHVEGLYQNLAGCVNRQGIALRNINSTLGKALGQVNDVVVFMSHFQGKLGSSGRTKAHAATVSLLRAEQDISRLLAKIASGLDTIDRIEFGKTMKTDIDQYRREMRELLYYSTELHKLFQGVRRTTQDLINS